MRETSDKILFVIVVTLNSFSGL